MKKIINIALASTIVLSFSLSCSKSSPVNETVPGGDQEQGTPVTATITATLSDVMTRVTFAPTYDGGKTTGLEVTWADGDQIRVYNHDDHGQSEDFTLDADAIGQKVGKFTGTLFDASSYDVEIINGSFDYASQTQPADGDTEGLKYLASASGLSASELQEIEFTEFSSVLAITAKMPSAAVAAAVKSVEIEADEDIFNHGKTLTITLDTPGSDDDILNLFATLPAGDTPVPDGTALIVHFNAPGTSHTVYTRYLELGSGMTFSANQCNTVNINATQSDKHAGKTTDDGSGDKPYLIGDPYQMDAMHQLMQRDEMKYFKMIDDVDMSGIVWIPLCNSKPFTFFVNFDGNEKTISNLTTKTDEAYPGLFGVFNGTAKNLTISDASIMPTSHSNNKGGVFASYIGTSDISSVSVTNITILNSSVGSSDNRLGNYGGGLCAQVENDNATIKNITVTNTNIYTSSGAGGVIGYIRSGGTYEKLTSDSDIFGNQYVGGVIGAVNVTKANYSADISKCWFTGNVSASNRHVGGIVGGNVGSKGSLSISNCYVTGNTQGSYGGGILGLHQPDASETTALENCYVTGSVKGTFGAGGIVGNSTKDGLSVIRCMPFNSEIRALASDSSEHYSSGAVIAYAKSVKVVVSYCYRISDMANRFFECPGNAANVIEQHQFITSPAAIPQRKNLTYGYYHHGRNTAMTLCDLVHSNAIGGDWSSDIWDWSGDIPVLK